MPLAERLRTGYYRANVASLEHGHGAISKSDFMRNAYPQYETYTVKIGNREEVRSRRIPDTEGRFGRWKNKASARRAYNKLTSLRGGKGIETSGARYEQISSNFYGATHRERIRHGLQGLWRVEIEYSYTDETGQQAIEYRTFIMQSNDYTHLEDLPYLYAIVPELADQHMEYWQSTGSVWQNYQIEKIEIYPIRVSMLTKEYESEDRVVYRHGERTIRKATWGTPGQGRVNIDNLEIG